MAIMLILSPSSLSLSLSLSHSHPITFLRAATAEAVISLLIAYRLGVDALVVVRHAGGLAGRCWRKKFASWLEQDRGYEIDPESERGRKTGYGPHLRKKERSNEG
ncbi:hypothetical protein BKA57DRAFT_466575 [Linnemannia elongata]|nr:hypothetical protein BKA57DRAFT_466575 [Linnemannia elongata]